MYALMYVSTHVKSDRTFKYLSIYILYIYIYYVFICISMYYNVWIRGMEQRYGMDTSNRYGTGVWNGGMERGYGTGVVPELGPDLLI